MCVHYALLHQNLNSVNRLPHSYFFGVSQKWVWRSISIHSFMVPRWPAQVLHPPQKFERPPFCNSWSYGIGKYGFWITFSGIISIPNFLVNSYWTGRQTDSNVLISWTLLSFLRQTGCILLKPAVGINMEGFSDRSSSELEEICSCTEWETRKASYLLFCGLFNHAVSSSDYIASNDRAIV
jgi:hypothetical protein